MKWWWAAAIAFISIVVLVWALWQTLKLKKAVAKSVEDEFTRTLEAAKTLDLDKQKHIVRYILDKTKVMKDAKGLDEPARSATVQMLATRATEVVMRP
jgi:hypothetical protein